MILHSPIDLRRSLLRPSLWFWLGVSSLWLFRVLDLRTQRDFGEELTAGELFSFGWDLCLAAGLFMLARMLVHPASSRRPRLHVWVRYAALSALVAGDFFVRAADLLYCTLTGAHFNAGAFVYMRLENLGLLRDGHNLEPVGALCVALISCVLALVLDGRAYRDALPAAAAFGRRAQQAAALGACLAIGLPVETGLNATDDQASRFVPESVFLREWLVWRGLYRAGDEAALQLPNGLRQRFAQLGLIPARPLDPKYPLLRAKIDASPFPYTRTAAAGDGLPNVVFTLVEQLNHEFVSAFSHELPGLMPEVSALAQRVTMLTNYQSVTQPTIHALVASLCSIHGGLPYDELNHRRDGGELADTRLSCLPEILRAHGYRTVYIQAGNNRFAETEPFLRAHGFSEIYGREQLQRLHPEREHSHWGVHDDVLVEFTEQKMRELEAQRSKDGRPFFVMAQTIDMHAPGHPPATCALPAELRALSEDGDSRTMLQAVHCTDAALGELGRFILDDATRASHTLWAMTGDHPSEPLAFLRALHQKHHDHYAGWAGRLPLLLHDPTHALPSEVPVLTGHLDLAPTLLHILGITDVKNAMEGYSMFGERAKYPLLLGRMAPEAAAIYRPQRTRAVEVAHLAHLCGERRALIGGDPDALSSCELLAWLRWQDALWKHNRVLPPDRPK